MRSLLASSALVAFAVVAASPSSVRADEPCPVNELDCVAVSRFSATAGTTSDHLLVASLVVPVMLETGRGFDDDSARRAAVHAGAIGATALTALVAKYTVRRDRPYTLNRRAAVIDYARTAKGSDHSFFSGHTSLAFAALTTSAVLYDGESDRARLGLWAGAGALGAATGVLRIRAGQHYPSDVITGAIVGTGFGLGASYLAAPDHRLRGADLAAFGLGIAAGAVTAAPDHRLRGADLAAFGLGIAAGAVTAALVPMPSDVRLPVEDAVVAPVVGPGFGGITVAATFR